MQNLNQIRAKNALAASYKKMGGVNGGEVIKKNPPLIMNHGLLAVGAYAFDEKIKDIRMLLMPLPSIWLRLKLLFCLRLIVLTRMV